MRNRAEALPQKGRKGRKKEEKELKGGGRLWKVRKRQTDREESAEARASGGQGLDLKRGGKKSMRR